MLSRAVMGHQVKWKELQQRGLVLMTQGCRVNGKANARLEAQRERELIERWRARGTHTSLKPTGQSHTVN